MPIEMPSSSDDPEVDPEPLDPVEDEVELPDEPLHSLPIEKLRLTPDQLGEVNASFA